MSFVSVRYWRLAAESCTSISLRRAIETGTASRADGLRHYS